MRPGWSAARRRRSEGAKTLLIVAVVLVAGVLVLGATKPDTFRVARATSINAPPEKIFPLIDDLARWGAWSPYEKKDPRSAGGGGARKGVGRSEGMGEEGLVCQATDVGDDGPAPFV